MSKATATRHKSATPSAATSKRMRAVRRRDTAPEIQLRSALYALGFRYRVHYKALPGTPDIAFVGRKVAVFVHGCFWHGHVGCRKATVPKTNRWFWLRKLSENRNRDRDVVKRLTNMGWRVAEVWECELRRDVRAMVVRVSSVLTSGRT